MPNPNYESLSPNGHETMITRIFQKLKGWVESLLNNKADKATTLSGYGITDAKIESGTITLGNDSITPLSSAVLANYVLKAGDTMTGALIMAGQDIQLKTNSDSSDDSSDLVWFYGNGQEKMRIWTANEYSTVIGPSYRIYKKDGTAVYSGQLAIHNQSDHLAAIGNKARLTTANQQGNYDASLFTFLATGSMTTGKPPEDAHIIHSCWDNNGGWDMQLALGHSGKIYTRSMNGGTWTSWIQHAMLSDVNAKVNKSGDTITGLITSNTAHGNSWNKARDSALIRSHGYSNAGSFYGAISMLNNAGSWAIGTIGSENRIYFTYTRNNEYTQNINKTDQYYIAPVNDGNAHTYQIAHSGNVGTGDSNGQVKIAGTNVSVKGLGSRAYDSTSYLPSAGGTITGNINWNGSSGYTSGLYWKENGYGDQFKIYPQFSGSDNANYLCIAAAVGGAGTSPSLTERFKFFPNGQLQTSILYCTSYAQVNGGIELRGNTNYVDFHYSGSTSDYTARILESSSGKLTAYNSISNSSDERLKKDIKELDDKYLQLLDKIDAKQFRYKKGDEYLFTGFIAQEFENGLDEVGIIDKPVVTPPTEVDTYYGLDYSQVTAILWKICQNQEKRIKELEDKLQ